MRSISLCFFILGFPACATSSELAAQQAQLDAMQKDLEAVRANTDEARRTVLELKEQLTAQTEAIAELRVAQAEGKQPDMPAPAAHPDSPDPDVVYSVPVGDSPVRGKDDAWVTIVEISDFQCPFCGRVQETLSQIRTTYGDDVRLVFKHYPLPFHQQALPAALASECARTQGAFWPMHDLLFANQRDLASEQLQTYAKQAGQLRLKEWQACFDDGKTAKARIDRDMALAEKLGSRGTPGFFINGHMLVGAQPFETFKQVIDRELEVAKKSGVARREYYKKMVEAAGKPSL